MRQIAVISFTENGFLLSERIARILERESDRTVVLYTPRTAVGERHTKAVLISEGLSAWCGRVFLQAQALIFVGACGIAVRAIAPCVQSKQSDPAVLVADEQGRNVISLLSGHLGGGNALTRSLAKELSANPVITTASDVQGRIALDVWARDNGLVITDWKGIRKAEAALVNGGCLPLFCEGTLKGELPQELCAVSEEALRKEKRGIAVSIKSSFSPEVLRLVPKCVILGIGCRRGKTGSELQAQLESVLKRLGLARESICMMTSIDQKAGEPGLLELADWLEVPFQTFSAEELMRLPGEFSASSFVKKTVGADNVCERSALAALDEAERQRCVFLCEKLGKNGITIALLMRPWSISFPSPD